MPAPINIATRPLIAHTAGAAVRPVPGMPRANTAGKIIAAEKQALENTKKKPTIEDRAIGLLNGARSGAMSLVMFGWVQIGPVPLPVPALLAGGLARLGFKSAKSFGDMALKAPIQALQTTNATQWYKAPGAMLDQAAQFARESEGDIARKLAGSLEKAAAVTAREGEKIGGVVNGAVRPVGDAVKRGVEQFSASGAGQQVEKSVGKLVNWRIGVNEVKSAKAMGKATEAFTKESTGFLGAIKNFVTRSKPATVGVAAELKGAHELLSKGKSAEAAAAIGEVLQQKDLGKDVIRQGGNVLNQLNKAIGAAGKVAAGQEGLSKGLSGMLKSGGKLKLYHAVLAAGVTAGVAATIMLTNKEGRMAKQALKDLGNDLGDAKHPLVEQAVKLNGGQGFARWSRTGISAVGEGVWLGTMNAGMSAMPALMGIQMLPQATGLFFKQNIVLDAYMSLKAAEKGEIQASAENKAEWLTQLVAMTPLARQHGAEQNIGAQQMGALMVEKGMSVRDALHTLNDPAKFEALAKEVVEKNAAKTLTPANDGPSTQVKEAAPATLKGAAPAAKIELGNVANDGRVTEHQKIRA